MKIAIIHAYCGISAKRLRNALRENEHEAEVFNVNKDFVPDLSSYDWVFSYGSSFPTPYVSNRLNKANAVATCVNKVATLKAFQEAGVPTVEFCQRKKDIPEHWEQICIRQKVDGRKAEDLDFKYPWEDIPEDASLYTQAFFHRYEYRIVVFKDEVFVYYKKREGDDWWFILQPNKGFEKMIEDARKASKALKIDYVGYDVVAKNKSSYAFLEANSGAILTDEGEEAIVNFFNEKNHA